MAIVLNFSIPVEENFQLEMTSFHILEDGTRKVLAKTVFAPGRSNMIVLTEHQAFTFEEQPYEKPSADDDFIHADHAPPPLHAAMNFISGFDDVGTNAETRTLRG